jgi:hypothetical protein
MTQKQAKPKALAAALQELEPGTPLLIVWNDAWESDEESPFAASAAAAREYCVRAQLGFFVSASAHQLVFTTGVQGWTSVLDAEALVDLDDMSTDDRHCIPLMMVLKVVRLRRAAEHQEES